MNKQEGLKDIIRTNIVTKIYEDRKINVTSRVKNAPPPGSHVFQPFVTIFEMIQDIIETYSLAKFYEDWNINMASKELTRQLLTAHDGHKAITKAHHEHNLAEVNHFVASIDINYVFVTGWWSRWGYNVGGVGTGDGLVR
ncbi:hypothetical protein DPMN_019786 [Dreissena polymorpha]|uniref:Uncharacterized protein n=1 Tax=Dreissena polymorpha TaxID=45954 RepID=A0A9D4S8H9_DREPO|nr:hypothetical protein DPMN_019786 [Dreissena polymorpha]